MSEADIHVEQYLGVWLMHTPRLVEFAEQMRRLDLSAHLAAVQARRLEEPDPATLGRYEMLEGGIAQIDLVGTMTKYGSSLSQLEHGTVGIRKAVRNAARDEQVKGILLRIDSPGGNFSGTSDLADEVHDAAQRKPVTAYIEDFGASAAYFVASQATKVLASPAAFVGSIGTYGVVADYSGMAAKEGIKVHVVRAGKFKGMGVTGTEITPEQLAEMQREVDEANAVFTAAVARGRKMTAEQVAELADGRVHVGESARQLGLVDAVGTMEQAIEGMRNTGARRSTNNLKLRSKNMSEQDTAAPVGPAAATLSELKSAFPSSTAEWREQCMEAGLTLTQCKDAWIKQLEHQQAESAKALSEKTAKVAELEKAATAAKSTGVQPLTTGAGQGTGAEGSDAVSAFRAAVDEKARETGWPRHKAQAAVCRERPDLREAYVEATQLPKRD